MKIKHLLLGALLVVPLLLTGTALNVEENQEVQLASDEIICSVTGPDSGTSYTAGEGFWIYGSVMANTTGGYLAEEGVESDIEGIVNDDFGGYLSLSYNGSHTLTVYAYDNYGNYCFDTLVINISGGTDPPSDDTDDTWDMEYTYACYGDDVYYYDNYGNETYAKEYCDYGCTSYYCDDAPEDDYDSQADYACDNDHVYWQNDYGNFTSLKEECDYGCSDGACIEGNDYYDYNCAGDDVWWEDQNGDQTEIYEECECGCSGWTCDSCSDDSDSDYYEYYDYYCFDGDIWWYDSNGDYTEIYEYCDDGCSGWSCDDDYTDYYDVWCVDDEALYWYDVYGTVSDELSDDCDGCGCYNYTDSSSSRGYCYSDCEEPECSTDSDCGTSTSEYACWGDSLYEDFYVSACYDGTCQETGYSQLVEDCKYGCSDAACEDGVTVTALYPSEGESLDVMHGGRFHAYFSVKNGDDPIPSAEVVVSRDGSDNSKSFYADENGIVDINYSTDSRSVHSTYTYRILSVNDSPSYESFEVYIKTPNYYRAFSSSFTKQGSASVEFQAEGAEETSRTIKYYPEFYQALIDLSTKYKGGVGLECGSSGVSIEAGPIKGKAGYECGGSVGLFAIGEDGYKFDYDEYQSYYDYAESEQYRALQMFRLLTISYAHQISPLLRRVVDNTAFALSGDADDYLYKASTAIGGYGQVAVDGGIGVDVGDSATVGAIAQLGVGGEGSIGATDYPMDNKESIVVKVGLNGTANLAVGIVSDGNPTLGIGTDVGEVTGTGILEKIYDSYGDLDETVLSIETNDAIYQYKFSGTSGYETLWEDLEDQGGFTFNSVLYYFISYALNDPYAEVKYTVREHVDKDSLNFNLGASGKLLGVGGELGIKIKEDTKVTYVSSESILASGTELLIAEYDEPDSITIDLEDLILNSFATANPEFMYALEQGEEMAEAAGEVLGEAMQTVEDGVISLGNATVSFLGSLSPF